MMRQSWIAPGDAVSIVQQCVLAGVCRATVYAQLKPRLADESDLLLSCLIDEEYTRHPFYGSRKMVVFFEGVGHTINRKRVQRMMRQMGLVGMASGPNTSRSHPEHKVYPYLLRGVPVIRPDQVWSTDITYIRLARGFAYLVAIIDWYSRRVLSWRISNSMEATFCVDCLEEALRTHGKPEIFNSDQGSQFTSDAFTSVLKREGIMISMDGRGRAFDNIFVERLWRSVKHEDIYPEGLCLDGRIDSRAGEVLHILQQRASAPVTGAKDTRNRVSKRYRWRGSNRRQICPRGGGNSNIKCQSKDHTGAVPYSC